MAYVLDITGANIIVVCMYGWSGAHQHAPSVARTDDLFAIVRAELATHPMSHQLIAGDINGEPEDFPNLVTMIQDEGWTDTGAKAELWGGIAGQPTCHASSKAKQTRRDYIFVNSLLLPAVAGMRVQDDDTFPTHQPVQIRLATTKLQMTYRKVQKTNSAAEAVEAKIEAACEELDGKEKLR